MLLAIPFSLTIVSFVSGQHFRFMCRSTMYFFRFPELVAYLINESWIFMGYIPQTSSYLYIFVLLLIYDHHLYQFDRIISNIINMFQITILKIINRNITYNLTVIYDLYSHKFISFYIQFFEQTVAFAACCTRVMLLTEKTSSQPAVTLVRQM